MTMNNTTSSWDFLSTGYNECDLFLHTLFGIYHPQILFAHAWIYVQQNYTPFQLVVWGTLIVQASSYLLISLPSFIFQFIPSLQQYKIQPNRSFTLSEQFYCIFMVVVSHTCVYIPNLITLYYMTRSLNLPYDYASMPRWYTFFPIAIFCLLVEDACHYWLHRSLHHPSVYGKIHKMHHTFVAPFAWTTEYAHPIEVMYIGLGFFAPLPFVCSHISIFWMWSFVRTMQGCDVHSGYAIYWNPLNVLPFYSGVEFHDYHHRAFNGNYGSTFSFWDKYWGTDADYITFQRTNQKERDGKKQQ